MSAETNRTSNRTSNRIPNAGRRRFLAGAAATLGAGLLAGCDRLAGTAFGRRALQVGEDANMFVQRLLLSPAALAREFPDSMVSPDFRANGTVDPSDAAYRALAKQNFSAFKLTVDGLVERPLALSLAELRALPARTQITRHDCVEGWSSIGKWTGVPLAELLQRAGLKPNARFVVLHCADTMEMAGGGLEGGGDGDEAGSADAEDSGKSADAKDSTTANPDMEAKPPGGETQAGKAGGSASQDLAWGGPAGGQDAASDARPARKDAKRDAKAGPQADPKPAEGGGDLAWGASEPEQAAGAPTGRPIRYYESIDLVDAYHPQTILAYAMGGQPLPVAHGAPLRLRVERQIGYKQAKYVMRIEVVESLAGIGDGKGGYWEDRGYDWYAGI